MNGFGVDRHLLGLKLIALEHGMDIPEIFKDAGFQKSSYMRLSTSQVHNIFLNQISNFYYVNISDPYYFQVVTKCDAIMGYAPLVPDGYSICYNPHENSINIGIGAFKHKDSNINAFTESLHECLNKMKQILLSSAESKL